MKETMKDVDKALREDEKRENRLAREISHTLNSRDHNEVADEVGEDIMASELIANGEDLKEAMKVSHESELEADERDEENAVKKIIEEEDKAINKSERR